MPELSEITEHSNDLPVNAMGSLAKSENETETSKILEAVCRSNNDKSGDWTENADAWYINSRSVPEEIANSDANNAIEWKYRNLYSMSSPNSGPAAYWSPRHAGATTSAKLRDKKSDASAKERKSYIDTIREYLANYQESYGTPRDEYTFAALIKMMGQATGRSLPALFYVIVNVTPIVQIFLYALRFVLDKMISIRTTSDRHELMVKYVIFGLQLLCIYVCLNFIFGLIVLPMLNMVIAILAKMIML